ncbi:MAG: DUF2087 domain-containing protein [Desulfobacteraceae bacterium]|nr:DUF2087 domain-containing protein [Desulfobacteraceae bacterium]
MSRTLLPFHTDDISALARSLKGQLTGCEPQPGHLELLNMLVRANGYRNFQHYRAEIVARSQPENPPVPVPTPALTPEPTPAPVESDRVKRLLRIFDSDGKLMRWPGKRSQQELCLWVIWSEIPARQVLTEKEINRLLNERHLFGDHPLLRRWLCDYGMLERTRDGREYRRIEKTPPGEALELIRRLRSDRVG